MLLLQRDHIERMATALTESANGAVSDDVVVLWRVEASTAALRFLDRLLVGAVD
jgi:hypothetical protein